MKLRSRNFEMKTEDTHSFFTGLGSLPQYSSTDYDFFEVPFGLFVSGNVGCGKDLFAILLSMCSFVALYKIGSLSKSLRLTLMRLPEVNFSKAETLRMSVGYIQPWCEI